MCLSVCLSIFSKTGGMVQFNLSNQEFLDALNLEQKKFAPVRDLLRAGDVDKAALAAAASMFAKPFKHVIAESEIEDLCTHIKKEYPGSIDSLRTLAKRRSRGQSYVNINCHLINYYARLYHLTGEDVYRKRINKIIHQIPTVAPVLSDDPLPPMFEWHAGDDNVSPHHFNYALYEIASSLPLIRSLLKPCEILQLLKAVLAMTDYSFRGTGADVQYNHPLGCVVGVCVSACYFPDFKQSPSWLQWTKETLINGCILSHVYTEDGYAREGFGYQEVNQRHLLRATMALHYSGSGVPPQIRELCKKSFTFYQHVLQNDGHYPLIGDCGPSRLESKYVWHQASVFFRLPALKFLSPVFQTENVMESLSWELGLAGMRWWHKQPYPASKDVVQQACDLRNSGFQIFGFGKGPRAHYGMLCYELSHNHAHHDVGSINISGYGRALISDPGKATYTQPAYVKECSERTHSLSCLIRRNPLGPRIDDRSYCKTLYVQHRKRYQAAAMQHTLYENHVYKRSVIAVPLPGSASADVPALVWFVYDQIDRTKAWPKGATNPLELVDTKFHFNAPESDLGIDQDSLTCWTKHRADKKYIHRFDKEDVNLRGQSSRVDFKSCLSALHLRPSNANIQVSAVYPEGQGARSFVRQEDSSTVEYGGRVLRPCGNFQYRGRLPFHALFVLIPFDGYYEHPVAELSGGFSAKRELELSLRTAHGQLAFHGKNLCSQKPLIEIA